MYEVLFPGINIIKVSLTTSTIKEPNKHIVTVRNSDIAKFGTRQERQTTLKVYADRRGPHNCEKLVEEQIQSHVDQFTRKLKSVKEMKHRRRETGRGASSSRSNISSAMQGHILKIPNFTAIRNQRVATAAPAMQSKRASDRNQRSPSYYSFDNSSYDSTIAAPPKQPRRAGDVENFQHIPVWVVETVQTTAVQQLEEANISPVIEEVSPPDPRVQLLIDQQTPTLDDDVRSMPVNEAENQENYD